MTAIAQQAIVRAAPSVGLTSADLQEEPISPGRVNKLSTMERMADEAARRWP
jgi:hypothetical protein